MSRNYSNRKTLKTGEYKCSIPSINLIQTHVCVCSKLGLRFSPFCNPFCCCPFFFFCFCYECTLFALLYWMKLSPITVLSLISIFKIKQITNISTETEKTFPIKCIKYGMQTRLFIYLKHVILILFYHKYKKKNMGLSIF